MDAAARPASVSLKNGQLTVGADNSDLAEILKSVSHLSGMQVEGLAKSSRVFGVYGPGQPQDVLAQLLNGSGYNFMMVGQSPDGAPLRLLLTEKTGSSLPESSPQPVTSQKTAEQPMPGRDRYGWAARQRVPMHAPPTTAPSSSSAAPPPDLGPGAIYPQPPAETQDRQDRVQQMMERLRTIHEQQNQLNENQQ